jgi:hypothetical protein
MAALDPRRRRALQRLARAANENISEVQE